MREHAVIDDRTTLAAQEQHALRQRLADLRPYLRHLAGCATSDPRWPHAACTCGLLKLLPESGR